MNCYFCGKPMKGGYSYIEHICTEGQWRCDACDYTDEYAYGATRVTIGDREFYCGYSDTDANAKAKRECDEFMKKLKEERMVEIPI